MTGRNPVRVRMVGDLFHGRLPATAPAAVYIGRPAPGGAASPYANPHRVGGACRRCQLTHDRVQAVAAFVDDLLTDPGRVEAARRDLAGRDLACWCPIELLCHGDVLLAVAAGHDPGTWPHHLTHPTTLVGGAR